MMTLIATLYFLKWVGITGVGSAIVLGVLDGLRDAGIWGRSSCN